VIHRWLVIRLDAPLMAFGGVAIDQVGPTRDFPAASMLTGLLANAIGLSWADRAAHQALQDRLVFGARHERGSGAAGALTDGQNAKLSKTDQGWTTFGVPEGRRGSSHDAPHRRARDYLTDTVVRVVLRLDPAGPEPTLEVLAEALDRPARPLFIGRKPCLPACRLRDGWTDGDTAHAALCSLPGPGPYRALWPVGEGPEADASVDGVFELPDTRNWRTGLHGGLRRVVRGFVTGAGP